MSSNYALYIKEREDKDILENDKGFVAYLVLDKSKTVYISDMFIRKEHRNTEVFTNFHKDLMAVAKENSCTKLMANVDVNTNNWEHSKMRLEEDGFKVCGKDNSLIFLIKEINHG